MPYKFHRLIMATVLPPLLSSLFFAPLFATMFSGGEQDAIAVVFVFMVLISTLIGWGVMILIGLPIHVLLCKLDKRTSGFYGFLGAVVGGVTGLIFGFTMGEWESEALYMAIIIAILGLLVGAVAAVLFHLIRGPHLALTEPANLPT